MKPRFYSPKYLHEVSRRTVGGAFLFDLNDQPLMAEVLGALGEAQRRYRVGVYHFHFMSNHYHGIFDAPSPIQLSRFFNFFHGRVATLVNLRLDSTGPVWSAKFRPIAVSMDRESLMRRMKYITGQATRAGMVQHPMQFAGPSAVDWLVSGVPITGRYTGKLASSRASPEPQGESAGNSAPSASPGDDSAVRVVHISMLPCFSGQRWEDVHELFAGMADDIAGTTMADLLERGAKPKPVVTNQEKSCTATEAEDREDEDDAAEQEAKQRGTLAECIERAGKSWRGDPPAACAKVPAPDPSDADTGGRQTRPAPGAKRKRGGPLVILACSAEVRQAYMLELQEFADAYWEALARLGKQVARAQAGLQARTVKFPAHAVLPSGVGGLALASVMAAQARA